MKVAIVGGSGGIGAALVSELAASVDVSLIHATYHRTPQASVPISPSDTTEVKWSQLDVTDEQSLAEWVERLGAVDWIVNCVGLLHTDEHQPEKTIRQFDPVLFQQSMNVNCLPTLLLAKYAHLALKRSDKSLFATVSARVGSIEDNRLGGWHSYRASKAALNMVLKCLAIEWARTMPNARVLSMHPGTTDTALSQPFQQRISEGKLFSPAKTAGYLLAHMHDAHEQESGRFIAWDGSKIPW